MRIWVAYRFTGADVAVLRTALTQLRCRLEERGHVMVTMIEDIQEWDVHGLPKDEVIRRMFELIPTCDLVLCVYPGAECSEGRGFEAGYFIGLGKPAIMALHASGRMPYHEALFTEAPSNRGSG